MVETNAMIALYEIKKEAERQLQKAKYYADKLLKEPNNSEDSELIKWISRGIIAKIAIDRLNDKDYVLKIINDLKEGEEDEK